MPIPKKIFTIWISESPLPKKYSKACKTHKLKGYEHKFVDLKLAKKDILKSLYLKEAIKAKKWIKVSDFARMWYLFNEGGIYLDCDMFVVKPFDDLLANDMFVGRESKKVIANSIIGAREKHSLLKKYLELAESNFKGDGEMIFEPAERLFTDLALGHYGNLGAVTTYSSEYFFPFDENGKGEKTKNTYTVHGFERNWKAN